MMIGLVVVAFIVGYLGVTYVMNKVKASEGNGPSDSEVREQKPPDDRPDNDLS